MSPFGQRLRNLRNRQNVTQKDLAKKFKISESAIGMYERGEREPSFELVRSLADFFDVSTDYLLGRTDVPSPSINPTVTVADQEVDLSPEQYKVFQEMMNHPKFAIMFHDLATDTEKKVKQLIDTWEFIRKQIEQDDDEEFGEGFGELED